MAIVIPYPAAYSATSLGAAITLAYSAGPPASSSWLRGQNRRTAGAPSVAPNSIQFLRYATCSARSASSEPERWPSADAIAMDRKRSAQRLRNINR